MGEGLGTQWEQLISSTMTPTTAVAVKLAVTPDEETGPGLPPPRRARSFLQHLPTWTKIPFTATKPGSPLFRWSKASEFVSRYRKTRFSSRRVRRRVVFKSGDCNVVQDRVAKRKRRYLQDIFTTLVDAQWRWTLLVFALSFTLSWLCFACIWWLIVYTHGDLDPRIHQSPNTTWAPCVQGVNSFTSCFLFSVETQHTIGYGAKHTTEECPEAIFVMCLQSITGVMIQAFMVGIVFAKLSRPKKRTQTLLFSRQAVLCLRDGQLCLMFRVGDMRKSHIIEAHVRAQLITKKVTKEGEVLPFYQQELKVGGDGEEDRIFFIWPTTIVHKINHDSPLYSMSATDMLRNRFEIVVILEGVIESTGMTTQARSSYLPNEILWGHRFEPLVSFNKETGEHEVDYSLFNSTYEVDTPLCSAQQLDQLLLDSKPTANGIKYGVVGLNGNGGGNGVAGSGLVGGSSASETTELTSMESNSMLCDKGDGQVCGSTSAATTLDRSHNHHHHQAITPPSPQPQPPPGVVDPADLPGPESRI